MKKSGYKYKLKYNPANKAAKNENANRKRRRKRNVTWFNPPYSENVTTNIGKKFLNLVDNCFPPENQLHKLLNRNTVKVSYSCMPNMKQIISNQNRSITRRNKPKKQHKQTATAEKTKYAHWMENA